MKMWLAIGAAWAVGLAVGCSSSSTSSIIPTVIPASATAQTTDTKYVGILAHIIPGQNPAIGWRLRNMNMPGNLPIDVTKVSAAARTLAGKWVLAKAHSKQTSTGQMVLVADSLSAYTPQ
jgi:hypothetical protein